MFHLLARRHDQQRSKSSLDFYRSTAPEAVPFAFDTELAFGVRSATDDHVSFLDLTMKELSDGSYFSPMLPPKPLYKGENNVVFQSDIKSLEEQNDNFECVVTESGSLDHALVVFHHWYSRRRYASFAKYFAKRGISVIEITLPYHFSRRQVGSRSDEFMLCANLGLTLHTFRQAVLDGRKVVSWLKDQGYAKVSVAGMCLGGTVAGLVAAHDDQVDKAALLVTPSSPADLVFFGETKIELLARIQPHIDLETLRACWGLINLEYHLLSFDRSGLDLILVTGLHDTIVTPAMADRFSSMLRESDIDHDSLTLGCGHYSLSKFPYNLLTASKVLRFLRR